MEAFMNNHVLTDQNMTAITTLAPNPLALAGVAADQAARLGVFADYLSRKAANTLRRQRADLDLFARYLAAAGVSIEGTQLQHLPNAWTGVTAGLVEGFKRWMLHEGYAIASVNVRLSTIKVYVKLAAKVGVIDHPTAAEVAVVEGYAHREFKRVDEKRSAADLPTRTGAKKSEAVSLTRAERKALKDQPNTPQGRRDALLMCLLLDHGLRVGEIAALTVGAFNLVDGTFTFYRPKVDKVQSHKLTRDTLKAARAYLDIDAPLSADAPLLQGSKKDGELTEARMSERAITKRVNVLGGKVGIVGLSAHDGRHSWATQAARDNTPIDALMHGGGWNSLAMPLRYVETARIANERVTLGEE
jgi:integrase